MPDQPVKFERAVPEGDNRTRNVCSTCGFIDYVNPKNRCRRGGVQYGR